MGLIGGWNNDDAVFVIAPNALSKGRGDSNENTGNTPSYPDGAYQDSVRTNFGVGYGFIYNAGNGYELFDGSNDFIQTAYEVIVYGTSTNLTIETKSHIALISGLFLFGITNFYGGVEANGSIFFRSGTFQTTTNVGAVPSTGNYTIGFIINNGIMRLFVNGVETGGVGYSVQSTITTSETYIGNLKIGTRSGSSNFDSEYYWFAIYHDSLLTSRMLDNHNLGNDMGLVGVKSGDALSLVAASDYNSLGKGLMAAYIFPDTGTNAIDECGENNDIPLTNTSWSSDGLVVNAIGEYGVLDNTGNNVVNSEAGTICFYIKGESSLPMSTEVVLFGSDAATEGAILLYIDSSDRLFFELYDSVGNHIVRVDYPKIPNWGTGTLISICWDRSNVIAFGDNMVIGIDGVYIEPDGASNETSWNTFTVESSLGFLNVTGGGLPVNGACKYSFFFDTVKTEIELAEILNNHNSVISDLSNRLTQGISAAYKLDEGAGPIAKDSSWNNNDATIHGGIWSINGIECDANDEQALTNNTSDSVISHDGGTVIVKFTSNVSILDNLDHVLFGIIFGTGRLCLYKHSGNTVYLSTTDAGGNRYVENVAASFSNWQTGIQISGIWNREGAVHGSSHLVLNVDGVHLTPDLGARNTAPWDSYAALADMAIGNDALDEEDSADGLIEYCYLFRKSKTEEEIRKIFNKPSLVTTTPSELSKGLMAAYTFPDSGTNAIDECGENNNIPLTNTSWSADGLVVNATGEYGVLDNTGNNVVNSEKGTICFYIKGESSLPMSDEVVLFGSDAATDGAILLYIDSSDRLFFELYDSVGNHIVRVDYPRIPNWGTGTLISICWDRLNAIAFGDNMVIGIDGVYIEPDAVLNQTSWNSFTVESSLGFLNVTGGGLPVNGACKYSFFFDTVKTEIELVEILSNYNSVLTNLSDRLSSGISASYKLDEGQGPTAFDSSGNNNNATINGTIWNAAGIECNADYEYALIDNTSEAVVSADSGTVIVYFTSNSIPTDSVNRSLFGNYYFVEGRFWIVKASDNYLYLSTRDSTTVILVANNYPILTNWQTGTQISGVWSHEGAVHGSSHLVLNVDGVHLTPDSGQNNTSVWTSYQALGEMAIGNEAKDKQSECNGIIGYCYVFKEVKTEEEIRKIFNNPELITSVLSDSLIRRIGCGIGCGI